MTKIKLSVFALLAAWPLAAQDNWCTDRDWHSDYVVHTETREERIPAAAKNVVNPDHNGSVHVHGWANSDILVKSCIRAAAPDQASATALAKQVKTTDGPGRAVASGPAFHQEHSWWSVAYEIWAPVSANLDLTAHNGSIHVEGIHGQLAAHSTNGSLTLSDTGGDVDAETTNGSVKLDVTGTTAAHGLKLRTTNGSIHLQLPSSFNADVAASTVNGSVKSDFAQPEPGDRHNRRQVHFTIGSGGSKIDAETVNGSVRIVRQS